MYLSSFSSACLRAAYRGWPSSAWVVSSSSEPTRRSAAPLSQHVLCNCPLRQSWARAWWRNGRKSVSGSSALFPGGPPAPRDARCSAGLIASPRVLHSCSPVPCGWSLTASAHTCGTAPAVWWNEATPCHTRPAMRHRYCLVGGCACESVSFCLFLCSVWGLVIPLLCTVSGSF